MSKREFWLWLYGLASGAAIMWVCLVGISRLSPPPFTPEELQTIDLLRHESRMHPTTEGWIIHLTVSDTLLLSRAEADLEYMKRHGPIEEAPLGTKD